MLGCLNSLNNQLSDLCGHYRVSTNPNNFETHNLQKISKIYRTRRAFYWTIWLLPCLVWWAVWVHQLSLNRCGRAACDQSIKYVPSVLATGSLHVSAWSSTVLVICNTQPAPWYNYCPCHLWNLHIRVVAYLWLYIIPATSAGRTSLNQLTDRTSSPSVTKAD